VTDVNGRTAERTAVKQNASVFYATYYEWSDILLESNAQTTAYY